MRGLRVRLESGRSAHRALSLVLALVFAHAANAQGVFARGDANCSRTVSAADFVAVARGLGGASVCGNEDCDRDGVVSSADVACTAQCLFEVCPTPAGAPQVTGVQPASAPAIVPLSTIDIAGVNFGAPDHLTRVTIGGFEAEVVDVQSSASDVGQSVEAVVPAALPPGPADLRVLDRDVAGAPMPISIAPAAPIGVPDTFDGTMALVDTAGSKLAALDLDGAFGDSAAALRDSLQQFRQQLSDLVAQLDANADFTAANRLQLDAAIDASGLPEMIRQLISDIDAAAGGQGGAAAPTAVVGAFVRGAQTIRVVQAVVTAAGTGLALPSAPVLAAIGLIAGVVTGVMIAVAAGPSGSPLITNVTFDDFAGPHSDSVVKVAGQRLNSDLKLRLLAGTASPIVYLPQSVSATQLTYQLTGGLCGPFEFQVGTDAAPRLYAVRSGIVPRLTGMMPTQVKAGETVDLSTTGIEGCGGLAVFFRGSDYATADFEVSLKSVEGKEAFEATVPADATPRTYAVYVQSARYSNESLPLDVQLAVTGVSVSCTPTELDIPGTAMCEAKPLPAGAAFPSKGTFDWSSSAPDVAPVVPNGSAASASAQSPGQAAISATFTIGNSRLTSANPVTLNVQDRTNPTVSIESQSPAQKVRPGGLISVQAMAQDNLGVHRIVLHAGGDAEEGDQEFDCGGATPCTTLFGVHAKSADFHTHQVTLKADVFDVSGLQGTSGQLTFGITSDTQCPSVTIQNPQAGATVKAGDTVQVPVLITDNQPDDTGVRTVRVNATGDAVATPPLPMEVTLPMPLPRVTRAATFMVKSAADLAGITNRAIIISASATDDAGNSCEPMTVTVMAGGPPIISSVPATVSAGATMTILGSGFGETQGGSSVTIGGKAAEVLIWSNNQIVVTVPDGLSGNNIPVVVTVDSLASNAATTSVLGTGDVQVTLSWSDINDLDLHVIDPNGEEVYYGNRMSTTGGTLDVDANAACNNTTTSPKENIFWPAGTAPSGTYTVQVVFFRGCGDSPGPSSGVTVGVHVDGRFMTIIDNATLASGSLEATFVR